MNQSSSVPQRGQPECSRGEFLLKDVQDEGLKTFLLELDQKVEENKTATQAQVLECLALCDDNNDRIRQLERYTSKNNLIIKNPPFNPRDNENLLKNILNFFKNYLKIDYIDGRHDLVAYHILPRDNWKTDILEPVIVRFVHFHHKDALYKNSKKKVLQTS